MFGTSQWARHTSVVSNEVELALAVRTLLSSIVYVRSHDDSILALCAPVQHVVE